MSLSPVRRAITVTILLIGAVTLGRPAAAQFDSREYIALQNQILELRRQVQVLQDQVSRGGGGAPASRPATLPSSASDLTAQLLSRVDALEEQVRQLRGRVDQTENTVQRQGADLSKRIDDLAFQTQNPQPGAPPPGPGAPLRPPSPPPTQPNAPPPLALAPPGPAVPPSATTTRRTPEIAMQEGNAALARRDYAGAEAAAREVLANRTSPRAYDAQFLLAQALAGQRQYSQAAIAYDDTYNRSKKGIHAPDALLGLADSLMAINEKRAACDTLAKLRAEYPAPPPNIRDGAVATAQRAGCR